MRESFNAALVGAFKGLRSDKVNVFCLLAIFTLIITK